MVLHEKGVDFETREVDLANKSREFLEASPTGKVPVIVVNGESLYESNVINQYLDEIFPDSPLMPGDPKARAQARIWMAFADAKFFPAVFLAASGRRRGLPEERIAEGMRRLKDHLSELEARLEGREYLAGSFSLADIAYAGNFVRLRELEESGELSLEGWPRVFSWIGRIEARENYRKAL